MRTKILVICIAAIASLAADIPPAVVFGVIHGQSPVNIVNPQPLPTWNTQNTYSGVAQLTTYAQSTNPSGFYMCAGWAYAGSTQANGYNCSYQSVQGPSSPPGNIQDMYGVGSPGLSNIYGTDYTIWY